MIIVDYSTKKVLQGKLWQYNYGQVLRIQGGNLQKAQEIQFALEETGGDSLTRIGITQGGVTDVVIPDTMLENNDSEVDYPVYVFIYNRDETSGETVDKFVLNVLSRSKPEHTGGSDDGDAFGKVIEAVNNAAERAETAEQQAAKHAEQTKSDAQQTTQDRQEVEKLVESVSGIGEQVQAVKEYKEQAQTAATNALLSEQKSEQAKEAALQAQARAESAEGKAEQHALEVAGDKAEVERLATQVRQDKSSVEQAVQGVGNTAQQAEQSINTAKTKAVEAVNATKTDAVKAVKTEGEKQTEAVQAKGQEVINSIPEDFPTQMATKLDKQQGTENAGKSLIIGEDGTVIVGEPAVQIEVDKTLAQEGQAADAKATGDKILQFTIKNTASGESIVLTDGAEEKLLDFGMQGKTEQLTTEGKNLFDIDEFLKLPLEQFSNYGNARVLIITLKPNTAYTMHTDNTGSLTGGVDVSRSLYFTSVDDMMFNGNTTCVFKGHNITKTSDETGKLKIVLIDRKNAIPIVNKEKYVMLAEGSTALPYEPYTGGKPSPSVEYPQEIVSAGKYDETSGKYAIDVKVTGKNLFDISKNPYKCDEEKICIPSKRLGEINITNGITFEEKTAYSLSWESYTITKPNSDWSPIFGVKYTDGTNEDFYMHLNKSGFKTNANKTIGYVHIRNPWSVGTEVNRIQIEKGTKRTEYEPFKLQTLTIPLDRLITKWDRIEKRDGVYGITYSSKHVIFNGDVEETWVKSSIDNAFYLQNFEGLKKSYEIFCDKLITYKGSVNEITQNSILGNTTSLYIRIDGITDVETLRTWLSENNLDVYYFSKESEFVPLDEETQTALNNLHTYYPTTVMSNSEDCEMEVEYVADTKNYIDNKISANVASIISQYQTNVANLLSLMPLSVQAGMVENDTNNILENVEVTK